MWYCVFVVNRRTASGGDKVQVSWQVQYIVRVSFVAGEVHFAFYSLHSTLYTTPDVTLQSLQWYGNRGRTRLLQYAVAQRCFYVTCIRGLDQVSFHVAFVTPFWACLKIPTDHHHHLHTDKIAV